MATNYILKPFRFNLSDLNFIRDQIDFRPLFDAEGNAIIAWDGIGAIYDAKHNQYATINPDGTAMSPAEAIAAYGQSYASVAASQGLRDPSGLNNNLYLVNATWGAVDQPFLQRTQVVYDQYVKPLDANDANAFYAKKFLSSPDPTAADYTKRGDDLSTAINETSPTKNVVDYTPRMISQLVTTAGVTFQTQPDSSHLVKDANGFTQVADYGMLQSLGQQDAQRSLDLQFDADGNPVWQLDANGNAVLDADNNPVQALVQSQEYFIGAQNPGVSPVNSWFVLFGQFFDHGLDFVGKGADGTKITINLAPDDPLYGVIDPTSGQPATKIVITRADVSGFTADGTPQWNNHTSPYIDQSQTYGSNQEVTDLLRQWVSTDGTTYHASAHMLDGNTSVAWKNAFGETTNATLPTLNELRAHLIATGRADLTWEDVANLRNRDASGNIATGAEAGNSGQALILDMNPRFDEAHFRNPLNPEAAAAFDANIATLKAAAQSLGTGYDFSYVDDVGSNDGFLELKVPAGFFGPGSPAGALTGASALYFWVNFGDFSIKTSMQTPAGIAALDPAVHDAVGDLLMAAVGDHYIAGDGRVNENIGLTAVHHVWHEEHNFQVRNIQQAVTAEDLRQERLDQHNTYNHDLLHEWQIATGQLDAQGNYVQVDAAGNPVLVDVLDADGKPVLNADGSVMQTTVVAWNEEKLFNAAKITVEMEYQHTAVDQFARTITPNIAEFVGYNSGEQADVSLDFSQVAYRFGHSTLRESIDLMDPAGDITGAVMRVALERAFLTPELFAQKGAAAIALGMTHQQANEVDEFVTPALNQGLLGMPLDLAAINIARGRDLGIPTLNEFRAAIGLTQYASWADFGANMIHPDNLVNFIAAYSFDGNVAKAEAIIGLDNGTIVEGDIAALGYTYQQALDFLQNTDPSLYGADGFQHIDTWLGGLAEVHVTGGLLGETFDTVFADQISRLMNGDRFYYLYRLDQLQMGEGIINEQFKDIVERNTGVEHLNGSVFAYADKYYDLSETAAANARTEHKYGDTLALAANADLGIYSTKGNATTGNGAVVTMNGVQYIRDLRVEDTAATSGTSAINGGLNLDGTPNSGAESHEVIVATDRKDLIYAWGGDDTVYGEGGDDIIYGGNGIDRLYGGDGNDRIYGGDGGDLLDGGAGDDYVSGEQTAVAAAGIDQIIGGEGNDILHSGVGIDKLSGESGDDFIFGEGDTDAFTHGGDGNDVIDGGAGGDLLWGDDGDDLIIGGDDQDISAGMNGDDIVRPGSFSLAMGGGPDEVLGGDGKSDLGNDGKGIGFDMIDFSDHAKAPQGITIDFATQQNPAVAIDLTTPFPAWVGIEGVIASQNNDTILADANANWLIGGSGNDAMTGGGGNDVIIGDGIRLDSLVGTYRGGYANNMDGASHRAAGFIDTNGLLDAVEVGPGFDKHFTEMLKSATFENLELGGSQVTRMWRNGVAGSDLADSVTVGDGGTAGTADTAVFAGNLADYTFAKINFTTKNQGDIIAWKVTDTVAGRDGSDVVVGVENFKFADGTWSEAQLELLAPVITSNGAGPSAALTVAENTTAVTTVTATDQNIGTILSFAISGGADATLFAIDATTGVLTFTNAPNFEAATDADGNNVYDVTVQVSDGQAVDTQALAVTIQNVNEAATGALNIASYAVINNSVSLTATNTIADPDVPALVPTYQWQRLSNGSWVNIAGATGATLATQANAQIATVRVVSTVTDPFGSTMTVSNETAFIGTSGGNTLNGTAGNDFVLGLGGNDTLTGGAGNDTVDGGDGNDLLRAVVGDGNDTYIGGAGIDTYNMSATTADANVNLTAGTASSTQTGVDTLTGIENVVGGTGANVITDAIGANSLWGNGGNDTFVLLGDNARDVINGGAGIDTADYSAATDNLSVTSLNSGVVVGGTGLTPDTSDTLTAIENFVAGAGNDSVTGSNVANSLSGGGGNDTLNGGAGNDTLNGDTGDDMLVGGTGNDTLNGGAGNDTLLGGAGADTLTGGDGNDVFDYNAIAESGIGGAARDLIADFLAGVDKIDFSTIDANTTIGNDQAFTFIATEGAKITGAGQLVYHYEGSGNTAITVIEGNINANLGTDFQVALVGHQTLTATDFVL